MSEPNNGQNQQSRPQTKAEIVAQREQVRMLGIALGNYLEATQPVQDLRTLEQLIRGEP